MTRKKTILLIDQDQDVRRTAATVLGEAGFDLDLASDGRSGLEKLEAGHHRGVLIDAGIACLGTENLGGRIAELATLHGIPVIMTTTKATRAAIPQGFAAGVTACLAKPLTVNSLRAVVNGLVQ
ncbi:MAG TPA: response regulator [Methylomirabilota bacterium]|nr:response regulator [Methylomirabilota bacterium]